MIIDLFFLVVLPVLVVAMSYMTFFGFDQMLRSRLRAHLRPGERILFESAVVRGAQGVLTIFTFRQGFLVATELRLLVAWWVYPPFWKTVKETLLADVDDVTTLPRRGFTQLAVSAEGTTTVLTPVRSRVWPFGRNRGDQLAELLNISRAQA
jgi:hypothetical protein